MKSKDLSSIQQENAQSTAGISAMEMTTFVQEIAKIAGGQSKDASKVNLQDLDRYSNALIMEVKELGVSLKNAKELVNQNFKQTAEVNIRAGVPVSEKDLEIFAGRIVNELIRNKNIDVSGKSSFAQQVKKEYGKDVMRQADTQALKSIPDKLKAYMNNFKEDLFDNNKKGRRSLANDLIDGLAKNKGIMGVISDGFKLLTFLGASYLQKFGTIGKLVGAGLVFFMPTLASLLGTILKGILTGNFGAALGALGRGAAGLGSAGLGAASLFSGFKAVDEYKKGETGKAVAFGIGSLSFAVGAIALGLAPFLGPYAPIALAIAGIATAVGIVSDFVGEFWDKIKSVLFDEEARDQAIKEGTAGFVAGASGEKLPKEAPSPMRAGYAGGWMSKHHLIPPQLLMAGALVGGLWGATSQLNQKLKGDENNYREASRNLGIPEGSPLKINGYGRVTNFGKMKRTEAWDAMMQWKESNPDEFNKRYEVIEANAIYIDSEGKRHKGSDLISFGSFQTDLSNKRGKENPTQIIMGKGFLNTYMQDMVDYKKQRGGGNPFLYQKITSGIGTLEGTHTKGGRWDQHDNPYGYVYDVSGGGIDDFVNFLNQKYPEAKKRTFTHGSGTGIGGYHGHISTSTKVLKSSDTSDLRIRATEVKEAAKEENKVGDKNVKPEEQYVLMDDLNKKLEEPLPPVPKVSSADYTGSETSSRVLLGIGNMVNLGADASYMVG